MKRLWMNNEVVFSLLLVTIVLSMASSASLLAEATIPNFLAIQGLFSFFHHPFFFICNVEEYE